MSQAIPKRPSPRLARFGLFEADLTSGDLRKGGLRLKLRGRPFEILSFLLERAGDVVTREQLRDALWDPDTFVDFDHGLNTAVNKLRETLGDAADNPRFVETLPRRGYRFIAPVQWVEAPSPPVPPPDPAAEPTAPEPIIDPAPPPTRPVPARLAGRPRRKAVLAGSVTLLAVLAWLVWPERQSPPGPLRIAVLPFVNLSGDEGQEFFVDGMTDALIAELAQLERLRVISRTSVTHYKGTKLTLPRIAGELGVDTILEGSVLSAGGRVRVTAQLIEAASDRHLWAKVYEREAGNVLVLQGELVLDIAREVRATLSPRNEARLAERPWVEPLAYEAYLRGRFFWDTMSEQGLRKSIELFERAIALDPKYAAAYAGLADAYWVLGSAGFEVAPQRETVPKARAAARKALELDPLLDRAEATLGLLEIDYDWSFGSGERRVRAVLERNPSLPGVHVSFSYYLAAMGRFGEAIAAARRGQELDPLSVVPVQTLGFRYYYARRFPEAETSFVRALGMDPASFVARTGLGLVRWQQGRLKEAVVELERGSAASGGNPWARASLAHVRAASGDAAGARAILAEIEEEGARRYVPPIYEAMVLVALGEDDRAFERLEKSYAERSGWMVFLKVEPFFDRVRSDPRFASLLGRVGLAPAVAAVPTPASK